MGPVDELGAGTVAQRVATTVMRLADAYVAEFLTRFPDRAELQGLSVERHDRLSDNSLTAAHPGIHLFGWSRERAAAFMAQSGRMTPEEADATVDRIAMWPGQFTAYDTGGLEFFALRARAEEALGKRFDIREFHDVVLRDGAVTLPMLREQVQWWLETVNAT